MMIFHASLMDFGGTMETFEPKADNLPLKLQFKPTASPRIALVSLIIHSGSRTFSRDGDARVKQTF